MRVLIPFLVAFATPALGQRLAITGATVIDGTGKAPVPDGVVLIGDGRITAVGRLGGIVIPEGTRRLDARGKYVIPGLMDANVHLALSHNLTLEALLRWEERLHEIVLEAAQIALKAGLTTVFDTWGPRAALVRARDMINAGAAPGSRVYLAGNVVGSDGPLSEGFLPQSATDLISKASAARITEMYAQGVGRKLRSMSPGEVRSAMQMYVRTGVDFIKYLGDAADLIAFSPRLQRVIVEEAHRAGLTVQAHVTTVEGLRLVTEAGVDIVTHGDMSMPPDTIPDDAIRELVDRGVSVSVLPFTERRLEALRKHAPGKVDLFAPAKPNRRNMIRAGVRMLLSTDAYINEPALLPEPVPLAADTVDPDRKLGEAHFNALVALEEEGMDRMEILRAATSNIARAYQVDGRLGTLEAGKLADLLVLDGDPLESARNYRRIHAVIKDGKVIDRNTLPVKPIVSATSSSPQ